MSATWPTHRKKANARDRRPFAEPAPHKQPKPWWERRGNELAMVDPGPGRRR